jgi:hypothetical protein
MLQMGNNSLIERLASEFNRNILFLRLSRSGITLTGQCHRSISEDQNNESVKSISKQIYGYRLKRARSQVLRDGDKSTDFMIRRREAKVSDVGGKKTLRPLPYTIYGNCRDKRFSVQARKDHFHTDEIINRMNIET